MIVYDSHMHTRSLDPVLEFLEAERTLFGTVVKVQSREVDTCVGRAVRRIRRERPRILPACT